MADKKPKAKQDAGVAVEPPKKPGLKTKVAVGVGATLIGLGTGAVIADQTRGEATQPAGQGGAPVSIDQAPTVGGGAPPRSNRVFADIFAAGFSPPPSANASVESSDGNGLATGLGIGLIVLGTGLAGAGLRSVPPADKQVM